MLFLYNLIFPFAFLFFIPGMIIKLIKRGGKKDNYLERFAIFSKSKKEKLTALQNTIWIHSVSVGETVIALNMIKEWKKIEPNKNFVLSTTTTTGQAIAQKNSPEDVYVIFCPIDFLPFVSKTIKIIQPKLLIIFETEIWPNLINKTKKYGANVALVNARMSDKSAKGYKKFAPFFAPTLKKLSLLSVQTELDAQRFTSIENNLQPIVTGNMKFDQTVPAKTVDIDLTQYFGKNNYKIILAASTHPGEEKLIASIYKNLKQNHSNIKLILVPRHAERGPEIADILKEMQLTFIQKNNSTINQDYCDVLLADTTGELLSLMTQADIVLMGKSFAGHDEGHNIIEPALLGKLVITGCTLRNFRYTLKVMQEDNAIVTVSSDKDLEDAVNKYILNKKECLMFGKRAAEAVKKHTGATERTIKLCKQLLK
jgi:3-deoxy-D-manno-octulosonic-acid transferase